MKVFVTDGAQNHALAVARSLGKRGIDVVVGESSALSKAGFSRFCKERRIYPAPTRSVSAFVASLLEEVQKERYDFLLPMTEGALLPISAHREKFLPHVRLPLPSHDSIMKVFNKAETLALANKLGVPAPKSWIVENLLELPALARRLPYPVVVKPRWSSYWSGDQMVMGGGADYAFGPDELLEKYHRAHAEIPFPLIQAFAPGKGYGIYALFDHGKPKAVFAHERIRDVRPTGSGSALRRSIPNDPTLTEYAVKLLEALQWHGVAMVEFKWDRGNSDPVLMEINGRFWNSLPLAIAAGVDFPYLLLETEQGRSPEVFPAYEAGLLCRWLLGDCRHLIEVFRGAPAGWPFPFPKKRETLLSFLRSHRRGMVYDTFRWEDPAPEVIEWLHFILTKVPRYFGGAKKGMTQHVKSV
jgi:predicted ATP-grasp superfamily ATP-dependent carboligase